MKKNPPRPSLSFNTLALLFLLLFPSALGAQPAAARNAAETELALKKLGVTGSVLFVGAHPDDENTALLSYLASERKVRTAYLSITRGDGGQNLIGTEKGELLGLVRTQELLAARRIDGAEQFFTRAIDFGYTKSPEEALRVWGLTEVLADVVWVIRRFRPDVIITRFPTTGEGGHGQHTASAILAREAFDAAGDPARFPAQLNPFIKPWKPKRLVWNAFVRQGERPAANADKLLSVDVGKYNPLLGKSYTEIAAQSRSMHKSQGMGAAERRGTSLNYFAHVAGEEATKDIFDGVDLTWRRVAGGEAVGRSLEEAQEKYDPANPQAILPLLVGAHRELNRLRLSLVAENVRLTPKMVQLQDVIRACAGLWIEAVAAEPFAVPGGELRVTTTLVNRSNFPLRLKQISLIDLDADVRRFAPPTELRNNEPVTTVLNATAPETAELGQPYWLAEKPGKGLFSVADKFNIGLPEGNAPTAVITLEAGEQNDELTFPVPILYRWTDRVQGEMYRPVVVVPEVAVRVEEKVLVFPDRKPKQVRVKLKNNTASDASGTLRLRLPAGWAASPSEMPVALKSQGEEFTATFKVTPPDGASTATLTAEFETGGRKYTRGLTEIDYNHVPRQTLFPVAEARAVRVDLARRGQRIGYVMGAGDEIPEALRQVGYEVMLLSDEDLDGADLRKFDAIVTGVRAYNTRTRLRARQARLLEYVETGGTLVVQYNTAERSLEGFPLGPYPFKLSQERVTIEEAPVKVLAPHDALLTSPNKITAADFDGWVQERGLNFPNEWDQKYLSLFETHDPGGKELRGSTLVARHGRGAYVYTSLAFFRQLPAGVPGAYRLFVNLISASQNRLR